MHTYIRSLQKICSNYAPSRVISFNIVHVFKTLQLIKGKGHVSRDLLSKELGLGEGSIRTLIRHLQMNNMIKATNAGTTMTQKGKALLSELLSSIPAEMNLPKCSIALGKFNYVVLLKHHSHAIKSGVEQRDAAIKIGAKGATTLLFKQNKFVMPSNTNYDSLQKEPEIFKLLVRTLNPEEGDAIIIGSDDMHKKRSEFAAKSAALLTMMNHEKHSDY
jgi:predicted transcriptional regulator